MRLKSSMADCFHERRENPDIRTRRKLGFHTMRPNQDSPGGGLGRYGLNRQLFRFYSDKRAAPVLCLAKRFFPDDSQPVIVTLFADSVLQVPRLHALTTLLSLINQLSPLDDSRGSFCFRYCHVLLSIVFQVYLFPGFQFFKYYG